MQDVNEPDVAEKKIHWWHEEISRIGQGEARHPACVQVQSYLHDEHCIRHCLTILTAAATERYTPLNSQADWQQHIADDFCARLALLKIALNNRASVQVGGLSRQAGFGKKNKANHTDETDYTNSLSRNAAYSAGFKQHALAMAQFDRLTHFALWLHKGMAVFSEEHYTQFKLTPEQLADARGKNNAQLYLPFIEAQIETAVNAFDSIKSLQENSNSNVNSIGLSIGTDHGDLAIITLIKLQHRQLQLWQKQKPDLLNETITLTPIIKLWHAWRCQRAFQKTQNAA